MANTYKKICFIDNIAPHYRFAIYNAIAHSIRIDFYFGDKINEPIKTSHYEDLKGFKGHLSNVYWGKFYWQRGSILLAWKPYNYYVITGEPYCISSWVLLFLTKLLNKKSIAWSHGYYGREGHLKKIIKKIFYSSFDHLLVYNQYSMRLMERDGISMNKMSCIANSLDSHKLKSIRENLCLTDIYKQHFLNKYAVIIYCGRIQKRKKINLLFEAAAILKKRNIHVNIVIVGKDVDGTDLMNNKDFLSMRDSVWFFGECYDDTKLSELFYNADLCVSPGNVGLTAIHSLTFGCPVVTHDNFKYQMPEFEAIQAGVTGDFFKQDDSEDLADKISNWIYLDKNVRERIRHNAYREIDSKWNIDYQVKIFKHTIDEL